VNDRIDALRHWVRLVLGAPAAELAPLAGDASPRRYLRVTLPGATCVAMDASAAPADADRYVAVARALSALGLNVPDILAQDRDRGFVLMSDLGEHDYLSALAESTVERLYGDALGALIVLQAGTFASSIELPVYGEPLLRRELAIFREWYLERHLGLKLDPAVLADFTALGDILVASALEQPHVLTHRDYHSRNLMVATRNNPGILDFQDAVRGPVTYDLVSLLRDCYISWPRAHVEEWALGYFDLAQQSGIPTGGDDVKFLRWFDFMGVQRHLKAVGIFARLEQRDGKPGYLADIPRTLGYVADVGERYADLAPLRRLCAVCGIGGAT
jgi:N-acetylmuramate 1-kinase